MIRLKRGYRPGSLGAALLACFLMACHTENEPLRNEGSGIVKTRVGVATMANDAAGSNDARIGSLKAFRVTEDGQIAETFASLKPDENGWCTLKPQAAEGTLYFVANATNAQGMESITSVGELLALTLTGNAMTDEGVPMTGKLPLQQKTTAEVRMRRSVARVDIDVRSKGVDVKQITVTGIADKGMLWNESDLPVSAPQAQLNERTMSFDTPLTAVKQPVCYLYEQRESALQVQITAAVEGVDYTLATQLPADIRRNTVYTLRVNGVGGKLDVEVLEADWAGTDEVNAGEESLDFTVDTAASGLPPEVTVNQRGDEVTVPYTATEFNLTMNTVAGTTLRISGKVDGVTVTPKEVSRSGTDRLTVQVKSALKSFTDLGGSIQLEAVSQEGISMGEIVLNFEANPCRLVGDLVFDAENYCRFGKQVEGELAVLYVPEGMQARMDFDFSENENGKEWIKMEPKEDGGYRLLAGWCTTFKKAMNGKTEAARLVITDASGKESVYTITRPYRSIPTVKVDNKYWSVFPMVGNSKNLAEQTDMEIAPNDLMNYLLTCTDEEFIRLQGSHYQGGNPQAVTFGYDETAQGFRYKGFTESAIAMNTAKDEEMLPEGWRLPTQDDMAALSWGDNAYLSYWDGVNYTYQGKTHNVRERKNVMVDGQLYGTAYVWSVQKSSERLIFSGFRSQQGIQSLAGQTVLLPAARGSNNKPRELWIDGSTYGFVLYHSYSGLTTYTMHSIKVLPEYTYQ